MGADFIYATAEMPKVPTLEGKGLYHDAAAKQAIVERLRTTILDDPKVASDLLEWHYYELLEDAASTLGRDVDWDDAEQISAAATEMVALMEDDLRTFWNGTWDRQWSTLNTYNEKGEPVVLTISGEMSWGDTTEMCMVLSRFDVLPSGWWKDA